jgi:tetratricopeptide (TPR) repeat protein
LLVFKIFFDRAICIFLLICLVSFAVPDRSNAQQSLAYQTALKRMIERPADAEASFVFAQTAAAEGRFREAIAALERVLILNPGLSNIKLEIGVLYLRLGQSAIAEQFIQEATNSPDAPPEVKARAAELLDIAQRGNERTATGFVLSFGVIADSNANSGPDAGTLGISADSTGRSDSSAFLRLSGRVSHDLGFQEGHRLVAGVDYYARRYSDETDLGIDRVSLTFGPSFVIGAETEAPASLQLTLDVSHLKRDGDDYLTEVGPSLRYTRQLGDQTQLQFQASYRDQDFKATTASPSNGDRTGDLTALSLQFRRSVDENKVFSYGLRYATKSAREGFEAYDEVGLNVGYSVVAKPMFELGNGAWRYGISAGLAKRDFDAPDIAVSATDAEDSTSYFISGSVEVPFENGVGLQTELGFNGNSSNYDLNDFDNRFVSVTITKSF